MLPPFWPRSILYNLCFYGLTGFFCIALLPTLFLKREAFLKVVKAFTRTNALLEKYILRLTYDIRGAEYLPDDGRYIIAAKHQSAYETFKLHILFKDPAIVLKKQLLSIPLWGKYLKKSDVIAIDRSSPKDAIRSLQAGARRMVDHNRPIIIFPQGTRVSTDTTAQDKPYKIGVMRIQEATGLPIIPMATNTGIFSPKGSFFKKPGKVVFEFLPPIYPAKGENNTDTLHRIEMAVEEKSSALMDEGRASIPPIAKPALGLTVFAGVLLGLYVLNWCVTAFVAKSTVVKAVNNLTSRDDIIAHDIPAPRLSGFPFRVKLSFGESHLETPQGRVDITSLWGSSLPFYGLPIHVRANEISLKTPTFQHDMTLDFIDALISHNNEITTLHRSTLSYDRTELSLSGTVDHTMPPYPVLDMDATVTDYTYLIQSLIKRDIIDENVGMMTNALIQGISKGNVLETKLTSTGRKVYMGPIKIYEFPHITVLKPRAPPSITE